MKIDSSAIQLTSDHASVERHTVRETLRFWVGNQRPDFEGEGKSRATPSAMVDLSNSAKAAALQPDYTTEQIEAASEEEQKDPKYMLLMRMLELLTGKKIKLVSSKDLHPDESPHRLQNNTATATQAAQPPQPGNPPQGWGIEYDRSETHYEAERTDFSAHGVIRTTDGKEISFNLQLSMQREFQSQDSASLRAGDGIRKDPLVINFGGTAAQLTDTKFAFDIDTDGKQDKISFVGPDSGFLALDSNANGKIDNGTELFGAKSGNGFADLATYDGDGNHWINENDAVYASLRVWSKDANGKDSLTSLAQHGVGALYLGSVTTPFSAKNAGNTLQGQVRTSGVYLNENGTAGTLQQLDLVA